MTKREGHFFQTISKPVIATLHLRALPGSPSYQGGGLDRVIESAASDGAALAAGGVDAICIQNNQDWPPAVERAETIAYMTRIATEMRRDLGAMPLGVSILPNGTESALAVAHAVLAAFVRIKVYVGAVVAFGGIIEGTAYAAQSFRARMGAEDIQIAADVYDRSSSPLGTMPIEEAAVQASGHGMAGALVVTGTSVEESLARVRRVKPRVGNTPVYVGGGTTHENVRRFLAEFDGVIVGHTLKRDKESGGGVDVARVREYMEAVDRVRR